MNDGDIRSLTMLYLEKNYSANCKPDELVSQYKSVYAMIAEAFNPPEPVKPAKVEVTKRTF